MTALGSGATGGAAAGAVPPRPLGPEDFAPAPHADAAHGPTRPSLSYWKDAWLRLRKNRQAIVSLWIICGLVLFTLVGPLLWRIDPNRLELARISEPPRWNTRAEVLAEPAPFADVVVPGVPAAPEADGGLLPDPA